jgi:hypothetical protein
VVQYEVMAGRLALVIGSQFSHLIELTFVEGCATELHGALVSAGWRGGGGGAGGLVISPTTAELKSAVRQVFSTANDAGATLFIAFIRHGVSDGMDFSQCGKARPAGAAGAARALDGLLSDYRRVLGPDHPDTLLVQRNHSFWQNAPATSDDPKTHQNRTDFTRWQRRTAL